MTRDMSARQFADAIRRYGMKEGGFMGYVNINVPGHHIEVSKRNAGSNRRAQLAYLLQQREGHMEECACGHMHAYHDVPHQVMLNGQSQGNEWHCRCGCHKFRRGRD